MFAKRQRKQIPPEIFISKPARICAIIQLCLAFTVIIGTLLQPFAGDLFTVKSKLLLYKNVMGIPTPDEPLANDSLAAHHKEWFNGLEAEQQQAILRQYHKWQSKLSHSFWEKTVQAFRKLALRVPAFEQAWILFSIILSVMLLKRVPGAREAIWLLPLITVFYALDNRLYGQSMHEVGDAKFFPSEKILVERYIPTQSLSSDVFEQKTQLTQAWKLFLIHEWSREVPSQDLNVFEFQAEKGAFAFNAFRLSQSDGSEDHFFYKQSFLTLFIFIFWNIFFAFQALRITPLREFL